MLDETNWLIIIVPFSICLSVVIFLTTKPGKRCFRYIFTCINSFGRKSDLCAPTGLQNPSTTCYANAVIQAAAASDTFIEQCKNLRDPDKKCLSIFLDLIEGVNKPGNIEESINNNSALLRTLILLIEWEKKHQQDALDLLSQIINAIQKELINTGMEKIQMPMKIKLVHRFKGMDCPDKVQDHLGLSVGLCGKYFEMPGESLEYLIKEHFSPTIIDGDESKTTQMFFYQQAPDVLLIHIQANKWDEKRGEMVKPQYYIKYEKDLNLFVDVIDDIKSENYFRIKPESVRYRLRAVVHHSGTISGGHYVTYREYGGRWYLMNDTQVMNVKFNAQIVPYIMIYEKVKE